MYTSVQTEKRQYIICPQIRQWIYFEYTLTGHTSPFETKQSWPVTVYRLFSLQAALSKCHKYCRQGFVCINPILRRLSVLLKLKCCVIRKIYNFFKPLFRYFLFYNLLKINPLFMYPFHCADHCFLAMLQPSCIFPGKRQSRIWFIFYNITVRMSRTATAWNLSISVEQCRITGICIFYANLYFRIFQYHKSSYERFFWQAPRLT